MSAKPITVTSTKVCEGLDEEVRHRALQAMRDLITVTVQRGSPGSLARASQMCTLAHELEMLVSPSVEAAMQGAAAPANIERARGQLLPQPIMNVGGGAIDQANIIREVATSVMSHLRQSAPTPSSQRSKLLEQMEECSNIASSCADPTVRARAEAELERLKTEFDAVVAEQERPPELPDDVGPTGPPSDTF